ncbi:MAG: glycogen debranching enzyme N-terminal domain-containing protein, partial [Elusimicrobia bacterium]|nr:glycogen debranching enzyme N-terminal domain-containing protein [Elusimicrobiota bacterium]
LGPTAKLLLRPFFSCRNHHQLIRQDDRFNHAIGVEDNRIRCSVSNQPEFYTTVTGEPDSMKANIKIYAEGYWYNNLLYAQEEEEEVDYQEDLFSPCLILAEISQGQQIALVFSREKNLNIQIDRWIEQEVSLRSKGLEKFPIQTPFARRCVQAADQFIVNGKNGLRITCGYPWASDQTRESLISLPGLCLATGKIEEARAILRDCSKLILQGLLPNRFHMNGSGSIAEYSSMDTPLWFIYAAQKFWENTKDPDFLKEFKPHIEKILMALKEGVRIADPQTPMEIFMDNDHLLKGVSPKYPLTWMNGKTSDWIATPRKGKPVEVQALWYNALQFYSELCLKLEISDNGCADLAKKARESFNMLFWNAQNNYLYDVIDGSNREGSIRPNALYAISLPYEILETEKFQPLFETAWKNLYTSLGLRTLSPQEPHFHGICKGGEKDRVSAAHNGTILSFLIGSFITAFFKTYGRNEKNKEEASQFLLPFVAHLADAGLGSVSEMFDGNTPHYPRGCIAEARGVAEILRVMKEEGLEI